MAIGELNLPLLGSLAPFLGPALQKAQNNVTASNIPSAIKPTGPYDFLNAMTALNEALSQEALRTEQTKQTREQSELTKALAQMTQQAGQPPPVPAPPPMFAQGGTASATASGAPASSDIGGGTPQTGPAALVAKHESEGLAAQLGISPYNIGYGGTDLSKAQLNENGFPIWEGKDNSHAAGRYQFQPATWEQYAKPLGIKDFSPQSQDAVFSAAYRDQGYKPWAPYNSRLRAALASGGGADESGQPQATSGPAQSVGGAQSSLVGGPGNDTLARPAAIPLDDTPAAAADAARGGFGPQTTAPTDNRGLLSPLDPRYQQYMKDQVAAGNASPLAAGKGTPRFISDSPFTPGPVPQINGVGQPPTGIAAGPVRMAQNGPMPSIPGSLAPPMPQGMPQAPPMTQSGSIPGSLAPNTGQQINPAYTQWQQQHGQQYYQWLQTQDRMNAILGKRNPVAVEEGLRMMPGGSMSPQYLEQAERAKALGAYLTEIGKIQEKARADVAAAGPIEQAKNPPLIERTQAEQKAIGLREQATAGLAPQKLAPAEDLVYAPGSVGAQNIINSSRNGEKLPDNVSLEPGGAVRVRSGNPTTGAIDANYKAFNQLADDAKAADLGLYEVDQLKQKLHEIGQSGPTTELVANLGAYAVERGVDPQTVKGIIGVNPVSAQNAEKLSKDLLGEILKQTFPQRITNTDIVAWKDTVPKNSTLLQANDYLIDKIVKPKFQRSIDTFDSLSSLPTTDPHLLTFHQKKREFEKAHPYQHYGDSNVTPAPLSGVTPSGIKWSVQ